MEIIQIKLVAEDSFRIMIVLALDFFLVMFQVLVKIVLI